MSVMGNNTIVRADIINAGDPVLELIEAHEQECPYHEVKKLIDNLSRETEKSKTLSRLAELVRKDRALRAYAGSELGLWKEYEFFIFGRPLSQILNAHGIPIRMASRNSGPEAW
jgi:hypothetical protein